MMQKSKRLSLPASHGEHRRIRLLYGTQRPPPGGLRPSPALSRKKLVSDLATASAQRRVVRVRGWARRRWADWRSLGGVGEEPDISLIAELGELGEETVDL